MTDKKEYIITDAELSAFAMILGSKLSKDNKLIAEIRARPVSPSQIFDGTEQLEVRWIKIGDSSIYHKRFTRLGALMAWVADNQSICRGGVALSIHRKIKDLKKE